MRLGCGLCSSASNLSIRFGDEDWIPTPVDWRAFCGQNPPYLSLRPQHDLGLWPGGSSEPRSQASWCHRGTAAGSPPASDPSPRLQGSFLGRERRWTGYSWQLWSRHPQWGVWPTTSAWENHRGAKKTNKAFTIKQKSNIHKLIDSLKGKDFFNRPEKH